MPHLTTLEHLKSHLDAPEGDDALLEALIARVSAAVQQALGREVVEAAYRAERHDGTGSRRLRLRHWPVQEVLRLSIGVISALRVWNDSAESGALAAFAASTDEALRLRLVGGPHAGLDEVALAPHDSVDDLAGAVAALGKGWHAAPCGQAPEQTPAADLLPTGAGLHALDASAAFHAPRAPLGDAVLEDPAAGVLHRAAGFPRGNGNVVVDYIAGYETVPGDIEHACLLWAAAAYNRLKAGGDGLRSEGLGDLSQAFQQDVPAEVRRILDARREVLA